MSRCSVAKSDGHATGRRVAATQHPHTISKINTEMNPSSDSVDSCDHTGAVLEPKGASLEPTGAVLEPTGVVLEPRSAVLEPVSAVL